METFCASNINPSKYRSNVTNNIYHNGLSCSPRSIMHGNEYIVTKYSRRTPSRTSPLPANSNYSIWQNLDSGQIRPTIGINAKSRYKGKMCSIALAAASFVVLVVVLGIAGMALYMGALHTETSNALLTFSCSAKILYGDSFVGALQEKSQRYERQLETIYQTSTLGPAFISCVLESFGNDTLTLYYKLILDKRKLSNKIYNVEKSIKDILLSDYTSRKRIFRNIRFDPHQIYVKQALENRLQTTPDLKSTDHSKSMKHSVLLKSHNYNRSHSNIFLTNKKNISKSGSDVKEEVLPVIQGSFKISKTEADITEKKTEVTTAKTIARLSTSAMKKSTLKESFVTSALHKIAAIEKVNKSKSEAVTPFTKYSTTSLRSKIQIKQESNTNSPVNVHINPNMFDDEPWIPILPGLTESAPTDRLASTIIPTTNPVKLLNNKQPFYTSFTNPSLSFHFLNKQTLGTNMKSHPLPVNKLTHITEPTYNANTKHQDYETSTMKSIFAIETKTKPEPSFVQIETEKYLPDKEKQHDMIKNISTLFHTLVSTINSDNRSKSAQLEEQQVVGSLGQGQVEVVDYVEDLITQTTKSPLVTLLPVKSNSGIGRPLRRRPYNSEESNNVFIENRSFPSYFNKIIENKHQELNKPKTDDITFNNFKIIGVLSFATESPSNEKLNNFSRSDIIHYPRMDENNITNKSEVVVYVTNSSVSSTRLDPSSNNLNILSADKLKKLSGISNIHNNHSGFESDPLISTKALSSTYTINHSGFKVLTKTLNKVDDFTKDEIIDSYNKIGFIIQLNNSECKNSSILCGDGKCLSETTKCNQLIDCNDGRDEENCSCADYLKSQYLLRKICDGIVDCWDYSDENQCEWCNPNQYVCVNSKICIEKVKICDGVRDCPNGDDERQCVTIALNKQAAEEFTYYSEGYLMVRKHGLWGKLCVDNFQTVVSRSNISWEISDLGKAVCKSMTYQTMKSISSYTEKNAFETISPYFELTDSLENESRSSLSFKESTCSSKNIVKVKCENLECGVRPQAIKQIARRGYRVVGGGNAGLGAWPWQAALYKEGEFQCGATLLSDIWLVSAGHCFYHSKEEHWVARLGALRRGTSLPSPYEQLRSIVRIIVHPSYIDSGFINDISLLQMEFPVVFSDYVRPICLPLSHQPPIDGRLCTVIGWGQLFEIGRIFPDTLQEVQIPIISTSECRKRTVFLPLYKITDNMFCAGYERGGRDACLGDSGGPLMCPESNGRWILHGITSNGYGCARANRPGVYTKVANYITWIHSYLKEGNSLENTTYIKNECLGHRCPLGECLPKIRLCNGYIECSDGSDEHNC